MYQQPPSQFRKKKKKEAILRESHLKGRGGKDRIASQNEV